VKQISWQNPSLFYLFEKPQIVQQCWWFPKRPQETSLQ